MTITFVEKHERRIIKFSLKQIPNVRNIECSCCKNVMGCIATLSTDPVYFIFEPCTLIFWGVEPEVYRQRGSQIPFDNTQARSLFCPNCGGNEIPEKLAEVVKKIKNNLHNRSVLIDEPNYIENKGCWITGTQFLPGGNGFFINAQVCPSALTRAHNLLLPKESNIYT